MFISMQMLQQLKGKCQLKTPNLPSRLLSSSRLTSISLTFVSPPSFLRPKPLNYSSSYSHS